MCELSQAKQKSDLSQDLVGDGADDHGGGELDEVCGGGSLGLQSHAGFTW